MRERYVKSGAHTIDNDDELGQVLLVAELGLDKDGVAEEAAQVC
jgi:hypothetical protein